MRASATLASFTSEAGNPVFSLSLRGIDNSGCRGTAQYAARLIRGYIVVRTYYDGQNRCILYGFLGSSWVLITMAAMAPEIKPYFTLKKCVCDSSSKVCPAQIGHSFLFWGQAQVLIILFLFLCVVKPFHLEKMYIYATLFPSSLCHANWVQFLSVVAGSSLCDAGCVLQYFPYI